MSPVHSVTNLSGPYQGAGEYQCTQLPETELRLVRLAGFAEARDSAESTTAAIRRTGKLLPQEPVMFPHGGDAVLAFATRPGRHTGA